MSRTVVVKVGAARDASWDRVFASVQTQARRARVVIASEMTSAGDEGQKGMKRGLSKADADMAKLAAEVEGKGAEMFNPAIRAAQQFAQESKLRFGAIKSDFAAMEREIDIISRKAQRDRAREQLGIGEHSMRSRVGRAGSAAWRTGGAAIGGVMGAAGFAGRLLGDVAHGAGVNTDLFSYMHLNQDIESKATQLSNSGYIPGEKGPAGQRVDPKTLAKEARTVANETAQSSTDALDGLIAFTEKTGDLDTGRKILKDMSILSKATGANMSDTVLAAAAVANQLGDVPNKAQAASEVMRVFAGQGQKGAIEIRNMATQMTKLAAQASNIKVNEHTRGLLSDKGVSTDMGQSIAVLGALSQVAMQKGGRGTATTATNSAMAFVRDLTGLTATKRFAKAGIDIFGDKGHTKERDPIDIIKDVLTKTSGSQTAITGLLSNQNSRAVVSGFSKYYNEARAKAEESHRANGQTWGSQKEKETALNKIGLEAAQSAYDEFLSVTMSNTEVQEKFALAMQTTESQVTVFNNKMAEASAGMSDAIRPLLIALAPSAVEGVKQFVGFIGGMAESLNLNQKGRGEEAQKLAADTGNYVDQMHGRLSKGNVSDDVEDVGGGYTRHVTKYNEATVSQEEIDFGAKKQKELEAAIEKQQKLVTGERSSLQHDDPVVRAMKGVSEDKVAGDEGQLALMKDSLQKLKDVQTETTAREMLGVLRVIAAKTPGPVNAKPGGEGHTPEVLP